MAERPSDRALLNEAIDLLCGCAPMAWTAKNLNDAAEYEKQITAFIARVRTLDAAPSKPVSKSQAKRLAVQRASEPSAECWRRAVEQWKAKHGWYVGDRLQAVCEVEALAREIAREGK